MATTTRTRYPGIFKRDGARGTKYDVTFRDDEGHQKWRTFPTLAEARDFKRRTETDVRDGHYVDVTAKTTVADYARTYLESRHDQRQSTRDRQASMVATHVEGTRLGGMPLAKVRREDVDAWLADRSTVLSRSTLRTVASLLRAVFRYAVENRRIKVAPVVRLSGRQTQPDSRVYAPTVDEVRRLADAMSSAETRAMVLVQAGTGLRISELLGLRVGDVSLDFRTVKVAGQLSRAGERVPCKTNSSDRIVPMPKDVADVLAPLLRGRDGDPDALLFQPAWGGPWKHNTQQVLYKAAVRRAGLPETMTSHALRHHYATTLLRAGLSPVAVGRLLGHTDGALVLRTYGHYMPDDDALARQALDAAWGQKPSARSGRVSVVR